MNRKREYFSGCFSLEVFINLLKVIRYRTIYTTYVSNFFSVFFFKVRRPSDVSSQLSTSSRESDHVVSSRDSNHSHARNSVTNSDSDDRSDDNSRQNHDDDNSGDGNSRNGSEKESDNDEDSEELNKKNTPSPLHIPIDEDEERKRRDRIVDELQERLQDQHSAKMDELEKQRTLLIELHEKLSLNESKQATRYEQLEKERAKLYKEQRKFLEKQLKVTSSEKQHEKVYIKFNFIFLQKKFFSRLGNI